MRREITCINKVDRDNRYESITHVGGGWLPFEDLLANPQRGLEVANAPGGGERWRIPLKEAIERIHKEPSSFWVRGGLEEVDVIVARDYPDEYLTTKPDTTKQNNLLSLPECPCRERL